MPRERRGNGAVRFGHQLGDFVPIERHIQPNAEPASMANVRWHEELARLRGDEYLLGTRRRWPCGLCGLDQGTIGPGFGPRLGSLVSVKVFRLS